MLSKDMGEPDQDVVRAEKVVGDHPMSSLTVGSDDIDYLDMNRMGKKQEFKVCSLHGHAFFGWSADCLMSTAEEFRLHFCPWVRRCLPSHLGACLHCYVGRCL